MRWAGEWNYPAMPRTGKWSSSVLPMFWAVSRSYSGMCWALVKNRASKWSSPDVCWADSMRWSHPGVNWAAVWSSPDMYRTCIYPGMWRVPLEDWTGQQGRWRSAGEYRTEEWNCLIVYWAPKRR